MKRRTVSLQDQEGADGHEYILDTNLKLVPSYWNTKFYSSLLNGVVSLWKNRSQFLTEMEKICADYRILLFTGARQAIMDCFLALYAYCPGSKRTSTLTNKLSTPVVRKKIQICFELWLTPSNSFPHRHIHKVIMQLEKQIYSNLQLTQIGLFPFLVKKYLHTCRYLWNHRNLLISFG